MGIIFYERRNLALCPLGIATISHNAIHRVLVTAFPGRYRATIVVSYDVSVAFLDSCLTVYINSNKPVIIVASLVYTIR